MPEIFIDPNGIIKLLANLNPNKAAGPDSIKPIILKELRLEIARVICLLFEKSLKTGQLPSEWTKAEVCPLYKKCDKTDPANYRPILLTCILCKVMEHVTASNISRHITQHNILYELQHGFREKRSCETQLVKTLLQQGISEPEFYGDLVYRFRKIVGKFNFSEQFRKLINRYKRIGYSLDTMRQTACLVVNPIIVDGYASLFNWTTAVRASDSMTASS